MHSHHQQHQLPFCQYQQFIKLGTISQSHRSSMCANIERDATQFYKKEAELLLSKLSSMQEQFRDVSAKYENEKEGLKKLQMQMKMGHSYDEIMVANYESKLAEMQLNEQKLREKIEGLESQIEDLRQVQNSKISQQQWFAEDKEDERKLIHQNMILRKFIERIRESQAKIKEMEQQILYQKTRADQKQMRSVEKQRMHRQLNQKQVELLEQKISDITNKYELLIKENEEIKVKYGQQLHQKQNQIAALLKQIDYKTHRSNNANSFLCPQQKAQILCQSLRKEKSLEQELSKTFSKLQLVEGSYEGMIKKNQEQIKMLQSDLSDHKNRQYCLVKQISNLKQQNLQLLTTKIDTENININLKAEIERLTQVNKYLQAQIDQHSKTDKKQDHKDNVCAHSQGTKIFGDNQKLISERNTLLKKLTIAFHQKSNVQKKADQKQLSMEKDLHLLRVIIRQKSEQNIGIQKKLKSLSEKNECIKTQKLNMLQKICQLQKKVKESEESIKNLQYEQKNNQQIHELQVSMKKQVIEDLKLKIQELMADIEKKYEEVHQHKLSSKIRNEKYLKEISNLKQQLFMIQKEKDAIEKNNRQLVSNLKSQFSQKQSEWKQINERNVKIISQLKKKRQVGGSSISIKTYQREQNSEQKLILKQPIWQKNELIDKMQLQILKYRSQIEDLQQQNMRFRENLMRFSYLQTQMMEFSSSYDNLVDITAKQFKRQEERKKNKDNMSQSLMIKKLQSARHRRQNACQLPDLIIDGQLIYNPSEVFTFPDFSQQKEPTNDKIQPNQMNRKLM